MNVPGHWELTLDTDGSGAVYTVPVFAKAVPRVRLNKNGVYLADDVATSDSRITG